jgi:hypothetical protein
MSMLYRDKKMNSMMGRLSQDICFAEISKIDTHSGPLAEFPPSVNSNMYCKVIEFAMKETPRTLEWLFHFVVKEGNTVRPSHVIKLATLFANLCFSTNRNLNAVIKMRSLNLQLDGLTNEGLDILSSQDLTHTARSLSNLRDTFSAVGPLMAKALAASMSCQACLDNCDCGSKHLTVEYVMFESRESTSHLPTERKSKEETLQLFTINTVLLTHAVNSEERRHLIHDVVAVGVGHILAVERPVEGKRVSKFLPRHHHHANSNRNQKPTQRVFGKPYPLMETKNSETVQLCLQRQRKYLRHVASWMNDDPAFVKDLVMLEDNEVSDTDREAAEERVKAVCLVYGEYISHGDSSPWLCSTMRS